MSEIIVNVKQGKLRGRSATDYDGKTFYSFQGIPYAKPPVGKLRFKDPQPADSWEGIRDATKEGSSCYQRSIITNLIEGEEDCLFLNVYTPQIDKSKSKTLKPVMFWIHGGGFIDGSATTNKYGPEFIVARDVVLVTTNYRLGMLGFLQLKDASLEVPGNAGLKDVILALQWVQLNIKSFLGDPNNVTIFGESAGSASVQYLMLSPLTKGLFHKAIMESGSVLNPWARGYHRVELYSQALNLGTTDEKEVLEKLQGLAVEELFNLQEMLKDEICVGFRRPVGPSPEKPAKHSFLSEEPKNLIRSGNHIKVPLLIGYNDAEGALGIILAAVKGKEPIHKHFELFVPHLFNLKTGSPESRKIAQKIKEFYFGSKEPSLDNLENYIRLDSDYNFIHAIMKTVENAVRHKQHPLYLYRFCVDGELNILKPLCKYPFKGASHADELGYLFTNPAQKEIKPGSLEDTTIKRMTRLWTNFAKYGNPIPSKDELLNVDWKPITKNHFQYLNIDKELSIGTDEIPEANRMKFWDSLYEQYPYAKYW